MTGRTGQGDLFDHLVGKGQQRGALARVAGAVEARPQFVKSGFQLSLGPYVLWALAVISFVYFNYWGFKAHGGWGYIKSIAPSGLPKPMVPIIWFFEFISLVLRVLTLAVRLYGNMFAGHMVLGIFALATSIFIQSAIATGNVLFGLPPIGWMALLIAMYALECLVAFLQAYVFTTLSAVYINLATSSH